MPDFIVGTPRGWKTVGLLVVLLAVGGRTGSLCAQPTGSSAIRLLVGGSGDTGDSGAAFSLGLDFVRQLSEHVAAVAGAGRWWFGGACDNDVENPFDCNDDAFELGAGVIVSFRPAESRLRPFAGVRLGGVYYGSFSHGVWSPGVELGLNARIGRAASVVSAVRYLGLMTLSGASGPGPSVRDRVFIMVGIRREL